MIYNIDVDQNNNYMILISVCVCMCVKNARMIAPAMYMCNISTITLVMAVHIFSSGIDRFWLDSLRWCC